MSKRLNNAINFMSAALPIEDGIKALICFDVPYPHQRCEIFDSELTNSTLTYKTNFPHRGGKLGLYRGKAITVGCSEAQTEEHRKLLNKAEILDLTGWRKTTDFPHK